MFFCYFQCDVRGDALIQSAGISIHEVVPLVIFEVVKIVKLWVLHGINTLEKLTKARSPSVEVMVGVGSGKLHSTKPAKVSAAPPAGDLVASLILLDGGVAVRTHLGIVGKVVLAGQIRGHGCQLFLPVPLFLGLELAGGDSMVGGLAVDAEGKAASWTLSKIGLPVNHGGTLTVYPGTRDHISHALQLSLQELLLITCVKWSLHQLSYLGWNCLHVTACCWAG